MEKKKPKRHPYSAYGRWVKQRIVELDTSVEELAAQIQVRPQNLSGMLHGRVPGYSYRARIESILGTPPADIEEVA